MCLTRRRPLLLTVVVGATGLLGLHRGAAAADVPRYTLAKDLDAGIKNGVYGKNGVYLATHPGGFYTGRLLFGQTFDRYDDTLASNGSRYYWGYAVGNVGNCFWLGPSQPIGGETNYLAAAGRGPDGRCTQAQRSRLGADAHRHIAADFNCDPAAPGDKAVFGGYTQTTEVTGFYFNLQWRWDGANYTGGPAVDYQGDLPKATGVYYRYTTRDGQKAAVFAPGYGWGFIQAAKVPRVHHWSRNGTQEQIPCDCRPDCTGRSCGADGCVGSCGSCGPGMACANGQCVASPADLAIPPPALDLAPPPGAADLAVPPAPGDFAISEEPDAGRSADGAAPAPGLRDGAPGDGIATSAGDAGDLTVGGGCACTAGGRIPGRPGAMALLLGVVALGAWVGASLGRRRGQRRLSGRGPAAVRSRPGA